jgi:hypothetical protein
MTFKNKDDFNAFVNTLTEAFDKNVLLESTEKL